MKQHHNLQGANMLVDPAAKIPVMPGTRMLTESLGLVGAHIADPHQAQRVWVVANLFAPIKYRALGGIRAKLVDNKGFVSFCNQRDLELLLGLAQPGDWCPWTGSEYPEIMDERDGWFGICCDTDDLQDDLLERENAYRSAYGDVPAGLTLSRRIHFEHRNDQEELLMCLGDGEPSIDGMFHRWVEIQSERLIWTHIAQVHG